MRPACIVISGVFAQNRPQMVLAQDDDAVQTFFPNGAHPALGECVGIRRRERDGDDVGTDGLEYLVKPFGELRIVIMDQLADGELPLFKRPGHLPRLLDHPGFVRLRGTAGHIDPPGSVLNEE